MKVNNQKILLWLWPASDQKRRVGINQLAELLPDLSRSGLYSLVKYLEKKQLILTDHLEAQVHLSLSANGKDQLLALFPALKSTNQDQVDQWVLLLFLTAPAADPNFRFLRSTLIRQKWLALTRGVYLYPNELPSQVRSLLINSYSTAVAVVGFKQWLFGDEQLIIGPQSQMMELIQFYSGISKELERLLTKINPKKGLRQSQKSQIADLYSRFYQFLGEDLGLIKHFYPHQLSGLEILKQIQTLVDQF